MSRAGDFLKSAGNQKLIEQVYVLNYFDQVMEELRSAIEDFHEENIQPCIEKIKAAKQDLDELLQELSRAGQEVMAMEDKEK